MSEPQEHNGEQGKTVLIFNVLSVCYVSGTVQSTWHVLTVSTHRTVLWQKVLLLLSPLPLQMSNQSTKVGGDALDFLGCFSAVFRAPSPPPVQPVGFHKLPHPVTPSWVQSNRKPQLETSGKKTGPAPFLAESWNWLHPSTFVLKAQPRASLGRVTAGSCPEELCVTVLEDLVRKWHPTPVFLPGKSHGWRNLVDYSPYGHKESDMTEQLHFHSISICSRVGLL